MTENPLLAAAKEYLANGFHPFPVAPRDKRPLVEWKKYQNEAPTVEQLDQWWTATPDANIGLPMGHGRFVLDVDGEVGRQALAGAGFDAISWDFTSVETGRGHHYYFEGDVPDRIGVLPKVDVRSSGAYVVAPPSIHANGQHYRWWVGTLPAGFPKIPPELLALLARPTKPTPAVAGVGDWVEQAWTSVPEGQRDVTCTRLAGYYLGRGVPASTVESMLAVWGYNVCDPPFPDDQVTKCVRSIAARQGEVAVGPPATIDAALDETLAEMRVPADDRRATATELPTLDRLLGGGFAPGELVLLGARPGVGKTALACQVARRTAKSGAGVLVVSREMTRTALTRRLLVQESQVRASVLKSGALLDVEWGMVEAAADRLRCTPLWLTQDVVSIEQLDAAVAAYSPGQLGLVVVDYLQLMRGPADVRDKRATVEYVSAEMKQLAMKHDVPMLVLSSLRRLAKRKDGGREEPDMSDLRESGELEHTGDVVLIMSREYNADEADLVVAKNRDGRVGTIKLRFKGELMTFVEAA